VSPPARAETPVYLITQVTASEPERLRPYLAGIVPLIERYDGNVLDIVRAVEILEGSWPDGAFSALVRSPGLEQLHAF
jgi:uncharacterized protein (DUF1330 family)